MLLEQQQQQQQQRKKDKKRMYTQVYDLISPGNHGIQPNSNYKTR